MNGQSTYPGLVIIPMVCALFTGCSSSNTPTTSPSRGEMRKTQVNSHGDGHPHRMTILKDGTEILTIGNHTNGEFVLLLRYEGEERFTLYTKDGVPALVQQQLVVEPER